MQCISALTFISRHVNFHNLFSFPLAFFIVIRYTNFNSFIIIKNVKIFLQLAQLWLCLPLAWNIMHFKVSSAACLKGVDRNIAPSLSIVITFISHQSPKAQLSFAFHASLPIREGIKWLFASLSWSATSNFNASGTRIFLVLWDAANGNLGEPTLIWHLSF